MDTGIAGALGSVTRDLRSIFTLLRTIGFLSIGGSGAGSDKITSSSGRMLSSRGVETFDAVKLAELCANRDDFDLRKVIIR